MKILSFNQWFRKKRKKMLVNPANGEEEIQEQFNKL